MSEWDRFNDQFRESEDERNSRLATARKHRAYAISPENLVQWADKIDNRLGPIEGRDADTLAQILRTVAEHIRMLTKPA